jgi:hypothetical protein
MRPLWKVLLGRRDENVSFIGYILLTKSLSCKVAALTRMPYDFKVFKYLEFIIGYILLTKSLPYKLLL